jgi:mTERF
MQARPLTVEDDMRPVVEFLQDQGISQEQVRRIIVSHPPILSYRVEERLKPFFAFMKQQGIESVGQVRCMSAKVSGLLL